MPYDGGMLVLLAALLSAPHPSLLPIEDRPDLPRVLLIGDSISIGYTLPVRAALADEANVHRPPVNCGPTTRGLEMLDAWLASGSGEWDVIHFNFGLHDLKYVDESNRNTTVEEGRYQVPPDEYRRNLEAIVERLQKTGATLIWRNTTPVPEGAASRVPGDAAKYNAVAAEVMKAAGIGTHDLFTFAKQREADIQRPANVHYTAEGSAELGREVARIIREALAKRAE